MFGKKVSVISLMVLAMFVTGSAIVKAENQEVILDNMAMDSPVIAEADSAMEEAVVEKKKEIAEFKMDQVVVTGTKSERVLSDVPIRTEIITAEDLALKGAVNLYEALDGVAGIRVEQQCSFCNFSQVRMQGLAGDHVQVLIDGQPIYSGLASIYGLQQIPASSVERIEVVKGASSALYGNKAISGVINVITKSPGKKPSMEISTSFGTDNTNLYALAASAKLNEQVDMLIAAQKDNGDIIDENNDLASDRVWSDNSSLGFRINVHELLGRDTLTFNGRNIKEARKGGELPNAFQNPFAEGSEHIYTDRVEAGVGYKKTFSNQSVCNFHATYTEHHRNATNDTFVGDYLEANGTYPGSADMNPYMADENFYVADINYGLPAKLGGEHFILGGVTLSHNYLKEGGMYVIVDDTVSDYGSPYMSTSTKEADDLGLYLQDEWGLLESLDLIIGGRYDMHQSKTVFSGGELLGLVERSLTYDENAFTPRVGLMFVPMESMKIRANVGQGFRVPFGFAEDLHLCSGSPRVFKGDDLKPEKSISYNMSVDYVGSWYSASANVFRTDLEGKVELADAPDGSSANTLRYDYIWENAGQAHTQGVELSGEMDVLRNLIVELDAAYTDAKHNEARGDWADHSVHGDKYLEDSKYISRVPQMTAGINVVYQPDNWKFSVDTDWIGSQYIDYNAEDDVASADSEIVKTDPYLMMTVSAAYTFDKLGLTLFAGAKNALNEIQTDKRPDDAAFMYKPYTGRILYGGAKFAF
ncbi:TonB-dependent receptor [bacterium]|nr:TonB-dependent receptor [bacterium]